LHKKVKNIIQEQYELVFALGLPGYNYLDDPARLGSKKQSLQRKLKNKKMQKDL
jgi:hypothetical protein